MVLLLLIVLASVTQVRASDDYRFEQLRPGVHVHLGLHEEMSRDNAGDIVNSIFIIGLDGVAVIDPGGSVQNGHRLLDAIRATTTLPVRWVILTHIHPDHAAAASVFPNDVEIIAHQHYPRALAQRGDFYLQRFGELYDPDRQKALRLPDRLVSDELELDIGGRRLIVTAHDTAHTDNDLTVQDMASNTLFASDLVFAQRLPSLDGSLDGWLRALEELSARDWALVVPGHGRPGSWDEVVEPQLRYLQNLRVDVAQKIDAGDTLSEVLDEGTELPNVDDWFLFDQVHPANLTKAYTELEWQ